MVSANALADLLEKSQWRLVTAESCTGGLLAAECTAIAGSSHWFERGFVTYSNAAKTELLGVEAALLDAHGAVSEQVARAMARGALSQSHAQVSMAVTGIAGPSGGSAAKPVGTVWFAYSVQGILHSDMMLFEGNRAAVRHQAVSHALVRSTQLLRAAMSVTDA
jgi:nicotinamide-nucleotide amidase